MESLSPGFRGRRRGVADRLPPGQYPTEDFPVLSAGPTPQVATDDWEFTLTSEKGVAHRWGWDAMMALPQEEPVVDIHCVTRWSKFDTRWRGVPMDAFLEGVETEAVHAMFESYGGYSTNVPLADLRNGRAWLVHTFDGYPLAPEHGGPARMLVPRLYFWKSAKWVRGVRLMPDERLGFWEQMGYHHYGDPWREQRVRGD
ncbi:molybdopterin-dependent oxidoreductase [Streptomyces radicis]|uniref:Sulfite oxidase-like oxidoreductase n=1 Tax=Streptomyces radicis TaxID=1750517 RepID=A0A3A9VTW1_9ACTN|nr:molybdopterin-dependent oxidoreductase [Streptomyces radicis]RKN04435.1 sulfite oxidase-like oxidoreductase [Streptomyces radicis]RKN15203.1 sulfite oxidase-like oxidoreductase [Streptomyces radicis]